MSGELLGINDNFYQYFSIVVRSGVMAKYNKASAIFKEHNKDLYNWVLEQAKNEDISVSAFIIRSLKKIREAQNATNKMDNREVQGRG